MFNDWALINIELFTLSVIELLIFGIALIKFTCGCIEELDCIITEELKADVKSANSSLTSFVFTIVLPNALVKSPNSAFEF